jgi:hypothetical protein
MRPTGADPPRRIVSWHDPSGAAGDWYSVVSVDIAANRSSPTTPVIAG